MNCFIAFTFNRYKTDLPDDFTESCQGRVIVEGVPRDTQTLNRIERHLHEGLKKSEPSYDFTQPIITSVTPLPDPKNGGNRIVRVGE